MNTAESTHATTANVKTVVLETRRGGVLWFIDR
jgi:hypothetical protein